MLDELHTYRGRQGADVAMLVRRVREALKADQLQCVGTSATLAGAGHFDAAAREVAAGRQPLFGAEVEPETSSARLCAGRRRSATCSDPASVAALRERVADAGRHTPTDFAAFVTDPLCRWIESTFGVSRRSRSRRLVRRKPRSRRRREGAAQSLGRLTGVPEGRCAQAIQEALLAGYDVQRPGHRFPVFAFRLHQFISRGDTVYASLEPRRVGI